MCVVCMAFFASKTRFCFIGTIIGTACPDHCPDCMNCIQSYLHAYSIDHCLQLLLLLRGVYVVCMSSLLE